LRNSMFAAFAVFLAIVFGVSPHMENHGLWLAFFLFLTLRGVILASLYPRLRRSLESVAVEDGNCL
jgi:MATE family multidrug resistance protein